MFSPNDSNSVSNDNPKFRGSLRNTFLLVLLPISIIFILLLGWLTYLRARTAINNQVNTQLIANLNALESDFNAWLTTRRIRLDLAVRQPDLRAVLDQTLNTINPSNPANNDDREAILHQLRMVTGRGEDLLFNQFIIATPDGTILIASQPDWENQDISETDFFKALFNTPGSMIVSNQEIFEKGETTVITSVPFLGIQNIHRATVFGISGSISLIGLLEDVTRFNPNAQSYLITHSQDFIRVDPYQKTIIRQEPSPNQGSRLLFEIEKFKKDTSGGRSQMISTSTFDGTPVIATFTWLPSLKAGLVVEVPEDIAVGELNALGPYTLAITLVLGVLLSIGVWAMTERLIGPLRFLTQATQEFAGGKWDQRAPVTQKDEIGLLSQAFNTMAEDLSGLYQSLEIQVSERTNSLEKRTRQLEATAEVAREAATIRNLDELLTYVTRLISEQFGFYHAGIFLLDNSRQFAILQAANSQGGQSMLESYHRLEVGQTGVVGYVAATGLHRIALDVGADAFFFGNPDLPNTRSELALPLIVRDLVIGVLDVQSTEPSAFDESDVEVLQILADQIALAIDNTRLYEQSQDVIRELQNAYRSQTKKGWRRWIENRIKAYHFDGIRITPATENQLVTSKEINPDVPEIHNTQGSSILTVPITLRDQKLGSITLRRDHNETPWTSADLSVVNDAISQVAVALENARLLDETRRSATREQLIGEITRKIRETLDIETIAKTATQEIREALDLSEVKVHLGNPTKDVQPRS
jgi:GAF domain-containing protein/HAMP domain-containing protein